MAFDAMVRHFVCSAGDNARAVQIWDDYLRRTCRRHWKSVPAISVNAFAVAPLENGMLRVAFGEGLDKAVELTFHGAMVMEPMGGIGAAIPALLPRGRGLTS